MSTKRTRDAEEMKKRKLVRQRLRNLIRSVVFNRIWLVDQGDQKLSLNVKKNIAMLVRTQRKIGMLTLAEKALIRTHHSLRSVEDRKRLVTLMAGLTCFSKIPPKVCARLVPVITFMFVGRGRTIIKEGDIPITIYFILSGEVEVTKKVFDHLQKAYVDKVESISGPGDVFGDVELIENCKRRNTYTSTTELEMLVLYHEEFDSILRPVMAKQWFDKKAALLALEYFSYLTEEQIIAACKLGVIREFAPLETIYYEDKGHVSYVHFVISGECMILQCLKMKVTTKKGNKSFELVDISKDDADNMFQDLTNKELMKKLKEEHVTSKKDKFDVDINEASNDDMQNERKKQTMLKNMDIKSIEISCGLRKPSDEDLTAIEEGMSEWDVEVECEEEEMRDEDEDLEENYMSAFKMFQKRKSDEKKLVMAESTFSIVSSKKQTSVVEWNKQMQKNARRKSEREEAAEAAGEEKTIITDEADADAEAAAAAAAEVAAEVAAEDDAAREVSQENLNKSESSEDSVLIESTHMTPTGGTSPINLHADADSQSKVENHFIDVGSLTFGGIFGLGEKLEHRVIMARTTVQCLLLPRFWLFEKDHNPGNIWQRKRFYLDSTIPSRQSLFQDFLTTRRWQKFKNDLIASNLDPNSIANPTKIQDIPIICRIVEATDD